MLQSTQATVWKQPIIVTFPAKVNVVQKQYKGFWGGKSGIKKTVLIVTSEEVLKQV